MVNPYNYYTTKGSIDKTRTMVMPPQDDDVSSISCSIKGPPSPSSTKQQTPPPPPLFKRGKSRDAAGSRRKVQTNAITSSRNEYYSNNNNNTRDHAAYHYSDRYSPMSSQSQNRFRSNRTATSSFGDAAAAAATEKRTQSRGRGRGRGRSSQRQGPPVQTTGTMDFEQQHPHNRSSPRTATTSRRQRSKSLGGRTAAPPRAIKEESQQTGTLRRSKSAKRASKQRRGRSKSQHKSGNSKEGVRFQLNDMESFRSSSSNPMMITQTRQNSGDRMYREDSRLTNKATTTATTTSETVMSDSDTIMADIWNEFCQIQQCIRDAYNDGKSTHRDDASSSHMYSYRDFPPLDDNPNGETSYGMVGRHHCKLLQIQQQQQQQHQQAHYYPHVGPPSVPVTEVVIPHDSPEEKKGVFRHWKKLVCATSSPTTKEGAKLSSGHNVPKPAGSGGGAAQSDQLYWTTTAQPSPTPPSLSSHRYLLDYSRRPPAAGALHQQHSYWAKTANGYQQGSADTAW